MDRPLPERGCRPASGKGCIVKILRNFVLVATVLLVATPARAASISIVVGDKDWFGTGLVGQIPGTSLGPWLGNPAQGLFDQRSAGEQAATNGAHLTDIYSALYFDYASIGSTCNPANNPGCTPNGDTGSVIIPYAGTLLSGSISMLMGDFECATWGSITAAINGVDVPFCFQDGFRGTALRTFALTPQMIAVANITGRFEMTFNHTGGYDVDGNWFGSLDYFAFDYFELNAEVSPVPEPGTLVLFAIGLAGLAAWKRLRV